MGECSAPLILSVIFRSIVQAQRQKAKVGLIIARLDQRLMNDLKNAACMGIRLRLDREQWARGTCGSRLHSHQPSLPTADTSQTTSRLAKAAAFLTGYKCSAPQISSTTSHVVAGNIRRKTRLTTKQGRVAVIAAAALNQTRYGVEGALCRTPQMKAF